MNAQESPARARGGNARARAGTHEPPVLGRSASDVRRDTVREGVHEPARLPLPLRVSRARSAAGRVSTWREDAVWGVSLLVATLAIVYGGVILGAVLAGGR